MHLKNLICFDCRLYESACAAIQAYAKSNAGRFSAECLAEDDNLEDLALVLDLLTFILSKDFIDFGSHNEHPDFTYAASDVSLFGLNFIMPLMTMDKLKFPPLCAQYYKLLVLIHDIYPEKISKLPQDLLSTLLETVRIGLTSFGTDIVQACLDFIAGMGTYISKHGMINSVCGEGLRPFLKIILDLILGRQISPDITNSAGCCLFTLICCYPDDYRMLVESLIQMQADPLNKERLTVAFNNLLTNVVLTCDRLPKLKFRDNFDKFITNVQGFLLVK